MLQALLEVLLGLGLGLPKFATHILGVSQNKGYHFWGPHSKDYSIGPPLFWEITMLWGS